MIALSVFFLNADELAKAVLLADTTLVERGLTLGAMKNKDGPSERSGGSVAIRLQTFLRAAD